MPCDPSNTTITPPPPPAGFGDLGLSPGQPDLPFDFSEVPLENLSEIFQALSMTLPGGQLKPGLSENFSKDIGDGVLSLLEKFMPFLYAYTFFMPVLNMILCILEILCAIPNPLKLRKAMIRLFRTCLPDLLALFPSTAVIPMLLSLLLLMLALIEYLIQQVLNIINTIINNIKILSKAQSRSDNDSVFAITKKIAQLLCILQNYFTIVSFIGVIIDIIKSLMKLSFKIPPCDSSSNSSDDCCNSEVCPSFIKNNETITGTAGSFQYLDELGIDSGLTFPPGFAPFFSVIRKESWQFYDASLSQALSFINITSAFDLPSGSSTVFFPAGVTYGASTFPKDVPYTIDFRFLYDPSFWGRTDPKGIRYLRIKNCIVIAPPTAGVLDYQNNLVAPVNGTLNLIGGTTTEDDGTTIFSLDGDHPATLNEVFHRATVNSSLFINDGYTVNNISYTFNINHDVLLKDGLITLGCMPDVSLNSAFVNATISNNVKVNTALLNNLELPDINQANACINSALSNLRANVTEASIATFQASVQACLDTLKNSSLNTINSVIDIGFSQYNSSFLLNPTVQFITRPVQISVSLKDGNNTSMTKNLPLSAATSIASKLQATASLGVIGEFIYDGTEVFVANITSTEAGDGTAKVSFGGKVFSIINNLSDPNLTPSITEQIATYKFVNTPVADDGKPRRDESDVSGASVDRG